MIAFCGIALQYRFHKQGDTSSFGASASHCDEHQDFEKNIEGKHIFHRKKQVDSQGHWWMHQLTFRGLWFLFGVKIWQTQHLRCQKFSLVLIKLRLNRDIPIKLPLCPCKIMTCFLVMW